MRLQAISIIFLSLSCCSHSNQQQNIKPGEPEAVTEEKISQIKLPASYSRISTTDSFGIWLRNVGLKKDKTVYLYNGEKKAYQGAQYAVLEVSVPKVDLQQCADAVMRLRAEYLFNAKKYEQILFKDNEGTLYKFSAPYTRERFDKYLLKVFGMCGTASLSRQLRSKTVFSTIMPGDVLIRGGFPGHAVIVMDVAENKQKERIYLLAQSYMPAQDIHVLNNPASALPWYNTANIGNTIQTPEYNFYPSELKCW